MRRQHIVVARDGVWVTEDLNQTMSTSFTKSGAIAFAGNASTGVFVYALQIVMGRMLRVQDYSLFTALTSVFNMTAVPLLATLLVVTREVALEIGGGRLPAAAAVRAQATRQLGLVGVPIVLVALAASGPLASVLGSSSALPVVILWVAVLVNMYVALGNAVLQGMQQFWGLAISNAGTAAVRLAACSSLVALGFGISGAMSGLVLSVAFGVTVAWILVERGLPRLTSDGSKRRLFATREGVLLAASNLAFVALTQIDYIAVRVFCDPDQASVYAAGAVLAKAVLWLPTGITLALFPIVASRQAGQRSSGHLLRQGLSMAFLASGALAAILVIGAGFWTKFLYGPQYAAAGTYLKWLSLAYLPLALVTVVDNYYLALRRARFVAIYALGAILQLVVFAFPGGTPIRIVWIQAATTAVCGIWAMWTVAVDYRRGRARTE